MRTSELPTAPAGIPDDARPAALFKNGDAGLFAMMWADSPEHLPTDCGGSWERLGTFPLGVQEIVPVDIAPEPVLRSLASQGYIVSTHCHSEPHNRGLWIFVFWQMSLDVRLPESEARN